MTEKGIYITKRQRFIIASAIALCLSLFFDSFLDQFGLLVFPLSAVVIYLASLVSLKEDIAGIEYITLFILPVFFFIGANVFLTILPDRKLYHLPMYSLISVGMYIIYLTENIFNVAAIRTIQLLRAAHAVSYLLTLITAFFLLSYIISAHMSSWITVILINFTVLALTIQFLWSFDLIPYLTRRTLIYTLATCIIFTQITVAITFYPQTIAMTSLFLIAVYYVLLGVLQHYYEKKLTRRPTIEYVIVAFIVFIIMIVTTPWLG
jgi:hypothetical protein